MKRKQLVERIAQEREVPLHTAADWLDSFLHDLMQQLRNLGAPAPKEDLAPPKPVEAKVHPADSQ